MFLHPQKKDTRILEPVCFCLASLWSMMLAEAVRTMEKVDVKAADHGGIFIGFLGWVVTPHLFK